MNPANLYEQDFYQWIEETAGLLRVGKLSELDVPNLLEEVEAMGRAEKNAARSNLRVLLMHLLKYKYQSERRSSSWKSSIREHRYRLRDALADSPSLKPFVAEAFRQCYGDAREEAADETGLPIDMFPEGSPFSLEQALEFDYLPG